MPVREDQIIKEVLTKPWIALAENQAKQFTEAGLPSHIRHVETRGKTEDEDAMTGHLCHIAVAKYLWSYDGIMKYQHSCSKANMLPAVRKATGNKHISDNGEDFINLGLDVKGSLIRTNLPPIKHNSPVRPREWHPDTTIVQCLLSEKKEGISTRIVYICGWETSEAYKTRGEAKEGTFKGAYVIPIKDLNPMIPMKWRNC
tara:strand:- start:5772 stop:6374 length:603 start_codon:yes stop_codon:yes gene_type:complete